MVIPGDGLDDLPSELVCNIFRLIIGQVNSREDRCRLMLVCRQWREYVEGSPLLWTSIEAFHGHTYLRRALDKSRGAMLDVHGWLCRSSAVELEEFMVEAGRHIARWRSLKLGVPRATPSLEIALAPLTTAPAPSLEILNLVTRSAPSELGDTITFFGGAPAPSPLRNVTLLAIPVAFEPLRLSGLVSLDLRFIPTISTPQLFGILRGSPGLETLRLENNTGLVAIESQTPNIQPIELTKLVSLSLQWVDNGATNSILSNISIPNRHWVSIRADIQGVSARSVLFTPSIAHLLHKTVSAASVPSSVIIVKEDSPLDYMIKFRDIELQLYVDGEGRIREILGWLVEGLGSESAECPVHFILDWPGMNSLRLAEVPPPLAIKHLEITDSMYRSSMETLYMALARAPNPTSSGWLLPQMERLSVGVKTVESRKQLVSMLRSRYAGATSTTETISRCPVNLRSIELRGQPRNEGLVEEIMGILGEVNVVWGDG